MPCTLTQQYKIKHKDIISSAMIFFVGVQHASFEPRHEKANNLYVQKQWRRSALQ